MERYKQDQPGHLKTLQWVCAQTQAWLDAPTSAEEALHYALGKLVALAYEVDRNQGLRNLPGANEMYARSLRNAWMSRQCSLPRHICEHTKQRWGHKGEMEQRGRHSRRSRASVCSSVTRSSTLPQARTSRCLSHSKQKSQEPGFLRLERATRTEAFHLVARGRRLLASQGRDWSR